MKRGRVKNPDLILETVPRRISLYFDAEEEDWLEEEEEELEATPVDPYLERLPSGIRRKTVPDIAKILDEELEEGTTKSTKDAKERREAERRGIS